MAIANNIDIRIGNKKLPVLQTVKNLGLFIDDDFKFKSHVSNVIKKCYLALKMLYSNFLILNFKLRKKLCEALVLSHINYCFIIYYPFLDFVDKNRLQKIQNNCCRFIFGLRKYDHVSAKIRELGWMKLDVVFQYHLAVFVYRLFKTPSPPYLRRKFRLRQSILDTNIPLRNLQQLSMPRFFTSIFCKSLSFNIIKSYNKFNSELLYCTSVNSFRKKIKNILLHSESS